MIGEQATDIVIAALEEAGFSAFRAYEREEGSSLNDSLSGRSYAAMVTVRRIALSEYTQSATRMCRADVGISVRLYGARCGFRDATVLESMAEEAMRRLLFEDSALVGELALKQVERDMRLMRLEREMAAVISLEVKEE